VKTTQVRKERNDTKEETMYQLPEINLLEGSHSDTGETGQGCFMNVVAYLNGESVITDRSECVCVTVRPIAIWLNDYCDDQQRRSMLPFILRAQGSRTEDKSELFRRLKLVVEFVDTLKTLVAEYGTESDAARDSECDSELAAHACATACATEYATAYAAWLAAEFADDVAVELAANVVGYTKYTAAKQKIIQAGIDFFDAALPKLDYVQRDVQKRIEKLCELANHG
jgi:hypothetical protein